MRWLLYLRLVVLTAGTLLPFFWMVVILGHRRQRNFERVFFFLCLALTCFFGCSLLALNAELYYEVPPPGLTRFAWRVLCLGLWSIPSLVVHLHVEYATVRDLLPQGAIRRVLFLAAWAPGLILLPGLLRALRLETPSFALPSESLGIAFQVWLLAAVLAAVVWQSRFRKASPDQEQAAFHRNLRNSMIGLFGWLLLLVLWEHSQYPVPGEIFSILGMVFAIEPLGALAKNVQQFNFLQIGRQRNLIYAVFLVFVALLYLGLVRRASLWLEPYLPPEASAAILLFLPVLFLEPLQRFMRRLLQKTAQSEVERVQRLMGPINEVARLGNLERLLAFSQQWIVENLQLADVQLVLCGASHPPRRNQARSANEESFELRSANRHVGQLTIRAHGSMISGETFAAIEFLSEQLPAAFDFCALIEEKLRLERELAERERLAALGQMAASISHNLKNPLGSIKTILQVQLENPQMPGSLKSETQMVLAEVSRLSNKLAQLLQFSRPAVLGDAASGCDAAEVVKEVTEVLRHEAERKAVQLEVACSGSLPVAAAREALGDILSNLIVNALEAAPSSGKVSVVARQEKHLALIRVEDDGKGIPPGLREKVLQPFFTTKTQGTGLGLAIVAKRVAEASGTLQLESPISDGRGTRFSVWLSLQGG
jgi:signal transduction histidine kinase